MSVCVQSKKKKTISLCFPFPPFVCFIRKETLFYNFVDFFPHSLFACFCFLYKLIIFVSII